jgi:hypothetical protein
VRRRTRDETRNLLLDTAIQLLAERITGNGAGFVNPLAGVLLTDVIEQANQKERAANPKARDMTTGAAYNIWPSQLDFQMELTAHVLDAAATPGIERVRGATLGALAQQLSWRRVLAETIDVDFRESLAEPTMFLMIGLAALTAPQDLAASERPANDRYLEQTGELLAAIIAYAGRRMRAGRSIDDLVWAIEALETGYLLRARVDPELPLRRAADGCSAVASAAIGVVEAFTEAGGGDDPT